MIFTITGKIKPYTRMTRRGKWVNPEALEYLASKEAIACQFKEQVNGQMFPDKTPLLVVISIETLTPHKGDVDNLAKALIDSAQGIVFKNDCWIDEIRVKRCRGKEYRATVMIDELH